MTIQKQLLSLIFSAILLGFITHTHAYNLYDRIGIASSPNPVGSGARAVGMGGAFIGIADDATAASWNPAGLIQMETPEMSVVGGYYSRAEDFSSSTNREISN